MNMFEPNRSLSLPGLYAGEVTDVQDPEFMGRIKVTIPSAFGAASPSSAAWARPCFHYGHFFVPKVGDKVWLAFENGDPVAPVWLGIWYPQNSTPDEAGVSPPTVRMMQSAQGHKIILDDTDGATKIRIEDKTGNVIEMNENEVSITAAVNLNINAGSNNIVITAASVEVTS